MGASQFHDFFSMLIVFCLVLFCRPLSTPSLFFIHLVRLADRGKVGALAAVLDAASEWDWEGRIRAGLTPFRFGVHVSPHFFFSPSFFISFCLFGLLGRLLPPRPSLAFDKIPFTLSPRRRRGCSFCLFCRVWLLLLLCC